jgi:transposase
MHPYSEGLREGAVQRAEAGETIRSIATALRISPSCVSKWRKRQRETGALTPGQMGGHKPRTLSGACADWPRARIAAGPFITRGLTAELSARGIKTDRRADRHRQSKRVQQLLRQFRICFQSKEACSIPKKY